MLVVRCLRVSSGGVSSISLRETYPAVLIKILGNDCSIAEVGSTSCFSRELKAVCTESGDVMSHSYVWMSSRLPLAP